MFEKLIHITIFRRWLDIHSIQKCFLTETLWFILIIAKNVAWEKIKLLKLSFENDYESFPYAPCILGNFLVLEV